jgi:hypothetical protein
LCVNPLRFCCCEREHNSKFPVLRLRRFSVLLHSRRTAGRAAAAGTAAAQNHNNNKTNTPQHTDSTGSSSSTHRHAPPPNAQCPLPGSGSKREVGFPVAVCAVWVAREFGCCVLGAVPVGSNGSANYKCTNAHPTPTPRSRPPPPAAHRLSASKVASNIPALAKVLALRAASVFFAFFLCGACHQPD